jgi:hypothetical protein
LVARAPRSESAVLVDVTKLERSLMLTGTPQNLGKFFIELPNGERWLEAHLPIRAHLTLALPLQRGTFLRSGDSEAEIPLTSSHIVHLESLRFAPSSVASRGSVERSLREHLFGLPFDRAYYRSFAAASDLPKVSFSTTAADPRFASQAPDAPGPSRAPAIALGAASATAAVVGLVSGYLAFDAYRDFNAEQRQRQAADLRSDVVGYRNIALIAGGVTIATGVGAWLTWPTSERTRVSLAGQNVAFSGAF